MYRIKEIRNKVGLTSSLVAQSLGLDLKVYLMLENNEIEMNSKILEELCYIFGCNEKIFIHENEEINCMNLENISYQQLCDIVHFRKIYATLR